MENLNTEMVTTMDVKVSTFGLQVLDCHVVCLQLLKLRTLGLTEEEAEEVIIQN